MLKLRVGELIIFGLTDRELMQLTKRPLLTGAGELGIAAKLAFLHDRNEAALVQKIRGMGFPIPSLEQQALKDAGGQMGHVTMVTPDDVARVIRRLELTALVDDQTPPNSAGGSA